ncbi:MAG: hypothetical protein KUG77_15620, partial [Nannocystaceae bacterium]|nr:hypothetical protein [Nannocystaceae bacterium]
MTKASLFLPVLLCLGACDPGHELADDDTIAERVAYAPVPLWEPWHGRWVGLMDMVELGPEYDYDATIALTPGICRIDQAQWLSAQWDYFGIGEVCTSELQFLGVSIGSSGEKTY